MGDIDKDLLEQMAKAAHEIWMESKLREGWKYGAPTDKKRKIHNCLVPYEQLCESDKESDRDFVRGIPKILEAAGFKITKNK